MKILERTQGAQVEDGAQVDVEPFGSLAGEHRAVTGQRVHGLRGEVLVVRSAARADVDRRDGQPGGEQLRRVPAGDPRHRVVLRAVPGVVGDRGDRPGVVEERVLVADRGLEPELVGDVGPGAGPVGDVDLVEDVVAELVEVGATVGLLQGDEVRYEGDLVGVVGTDKRVDVGVVGYGVFGDLGCLAV